ncbi:MAG: LIC_13387 family protein [Pseudoxanthomonas sp.]
MTTGDLAAWLVALSAAILLFLGLVHLLYTFHGRKLHPRDPALEEAMQRGHPVLTRRTTMWKAWVGFNASHSMGAILFGLVYGYLAMVQGALLFASPFLLTTGLILLLGYTLVGRRYWFRAPNSGIFAATGLYIAGLVVAFVRV